MAPGENAVVLMSVTDDLRNSQYWLRRAEECRGLAETFHNAVARGRMFKNAQDYQRMSDQAAARELAKAHAAQGK
jgi:hypothetical protein